MSGRDESTEGLDKSAPDMACLGNGRNQPLSVRATIRTVRGDAGRALAIAQGEALRALLARLDEVRVEGRAGET